MSVRFFYSICLLLTSFAAHAAPWAPKRPKLAVVIVIDQFRSDYLSRFKDEFGKNGFNALIDHGAYFPYAEYDVLQAMTAPGHATVLSGAYPYQMGIPINDWFDQTTGRVRESVQDPTVKAIGPGLEEFDGSSPRNMIGPTLGDEMKNADLPTRVVSLAIKDRAAVLMGGHRADLAFWWDKRVKRWTTSTYYREKLPEWLNDLNAHLAQGQACNLAEACGIEMTTDTFQAALKNEHLGTGPGTDILAVSFSSHDVAGHTFGPNDDRMHLLTLAEDRAVARLREAVKREVPGGLRDVVFVLTGDHGVAPSPSYIAKTPIPGGRLDEAKLLGDISAALDHRFGAKVKPWLAHVMALNFFLNESALERAKIPMAEVQAEIKTVLLKHPAIAHALTADDLDHRRRLPEGFARKVDRTYYRGRSGHVVGVLKPYYIAGHNEANHMTGYVYDRTVPLVFAGFGIRNMVSGRRVGVVDLAPTLAFLLRSLPPALSEGQVLNDALKDVPPPGDVVR